MKVLSGFGDRSGTWNGAGGRKTIIESTFFLNNDLTEITGHLSRQDLDELQSVNISDFEEEFGDEISIKN